jgi:hypothetical protein
MCIFSLDRAGRWPYIRRISNEEDIMIGTEKQVAYAKAILAGARAYWEWRKQQPRMERHAALQIAAIDLIEAIDRGDHEEAMRLLETEDIPEWVDVEHCIAKRDPRSCTGWSRDGIESLDEAVVVAAMIIDTLKRDYYAAKDNGLLEERA